MRVFVTGATGYVGFAIAAALRRAGHEVYGLTRSAAKASQLARQEIHPVQGDIGDPKSYADAAEECSVLVHAAFESSASAVAKDKGAIDALIEAGRRGARPKTLIFTSGVWVHGDTGGKLVDETTPLNPIKLVAWRPAHEQMVLQAKTVRGLVIRPGCVYGGRGGMTGDWFAAVVAGKPPTVVGTGHNRWAMVHGDDLADAYVRAAESGLAGEPFDVVDRWRATGGERGPAAARALGYSGELRATPLAEARRTIGDYADALALHQHVDARKAVRLLGWQPHRLTRVHVLVQCQRVRVVPNGPACLGEGRRPQLARVAQGARRRGPPLAAGGAPPVDHVERLAREPALGGAHIGIRQVVAVHHRPTVVAGPHHRRWLAGHHGGEPVARHPAPPTVHAAGSDHQPAYGLRLQYHLLVRRSPGDQFDGIEGSRLVHQLAAGVAMHPDAARENQRLGPRAAPPGLDQGVDGALVLGHGAGRGLERGMHQDATFLGRIGVALGVPDVPLHRMNLLAREL